MKNKVLFVVVLIVLIIVFIVLGGNGNKTNMEVVKEGQIRFIYDEQKIIHTLTEKEIAELKLLFNNKRIYNDNPSCGFSEDIAIKFDDMMTFCIARDTCPIIYWKEKDKYFKISEEEQRVLYELLEKYGAFFPCV